MNCASSVYLDRNEVSRLAHDRITSSKLGTFLARQPLLQFQLFERTDVIVYPLLTSSGAIAASVTCSRSCKLLLNRNWARDERLEVNMHRLFQCATRNMCLRIMFVFRGRDRITRPVSKTVPVKTTCYEFLLIYGPSFRSCFPFPRLVPLEDACRELLHEKRLTRKAGNRDSSFSLKFACVSLIVASPSYMDSESSRRSSTSWTPKVSSSCSTTEANSSISRSKAVVKSDSSSHDSSSSEFGSSSASFASVSWAV